MLILGTKVHNITMEGAIKRAENFLYDSKQHYIVTPNPEIIIHALRNPEYRSVINRSSISMPDGTGILWASGILHGDKIRERVSGVDFIYKFLEHLDRKNNSRSGASLNAIPIFESAANVENRILLAGGKNGVAKMSSRILEERFPSLKFYCMENIDSERALSAIRSIIRPSIIFVALGAPKQEIWIKDNLKSFPTVKIAMGVGGSLDFISGKVPRAPRCMQKIGLEWLWRFLMQPRRFPRIVNAVIVFPAFVLVYKLRKLSTL